MSIHSEHPFATPAGQRSDLRRFRGRMVAPVSVWTAQVGGRRAGWTVSSFLVADGEPGEVVGVLDEDSDLAELVGDDRFEGRIAVNLLGWEHRQLADAFAGQAPAPGGVFRRGRWTESDWGPVLSGSVGWIGAAIAGEPTHAGWGLLLRALVEHVEVPEAGDELLAHVRGRYRSIGAD